jgi:sugar porter (SP) family MFS transporter
MGAALWGTVLGALIGSWPTDKFGRKKTLMTIGILYVVSAVWSALAPEVNSFIVARFIGGLGVGISTVAAPLFISEIAPAKYRGRLAGMFQFNIVFGILIAFASNYMLGGLGDHAWRWMLGVEAIPAVIYSILCFGLPESPRWLIGRKNDFESGMAVLRQIHPEFSEEDVRAKADEIVTASNAPRSAGGFWTRHLSVPIFLAFMIAFFNQLSGINAVLYFSKRIMESTGLDANAALWQSVKIGLTNFGFTFVGLWLIDRIGRRTLLYIGSIGYILSLGMCSWAYASGNKDIVPLCIFVFIAAHAVGQGAVIWVFISEIFPNRHRAQGTSLGCFTHWIFAALVTQAFALMVASLEESVIFGFFCFMMVLQLAWVKFFVPETKGTSLEEVEAQLDKQA